MVYKYKVPKNERKRYENKKVIYCEIVNKLKPAMKDIEIYLVKELNNQNRLTIFFNYELEKLNFIDKIKLKLGGIK